MDEKRSPGCARPLQVGFDGTSLANRRGFGRFARGILSGLVESNPGHDIHVLVDSKSADSVDFPQGLTVHRVMMERSPSKAASAQGSRSLGDILKMSREVSKRNLDVYYLPSSFTYFPLMPGQRSIVTMHDTLALERPDLVFPTKRGRWFWWLKEQAARWNYSRLTTVSETSRRDLSQFFRIPEERIGLLTEGVESIFLNDPDQLPMYSHVCEKFAIPSDCKYWLYVGGLSPHKNLIRLIEAFSDLPESVGNLVLVGDFGDNFHTNIPELRQKAAQCDVTQRVIFTGFVPDPELATLYRNARGVVLPSLWEGFGLPAAEAMASGTAVLHSTAGSLPEIVGEGGLSFDPLNITDLCNKWLLMDQDDQLRHSLAERGRKRSERYRWKVAGSLLWDEIVHLNSRKSGLSRYAG